MATIIHGICGSPVKMGATQDIAGRARLKSEQLGVRPAVHVRGRRVRFPSTQVDGQLQAPTRAISIAPQNVYFTSPVRLSNRRTRRILRATIETDSQKARERDEHGTARLYRH